jgi:hypothetical protein
VIEVDLTQDLGPSSQASRVGIPTDKTDKTPPAGVLSVLSVSVRRAIRPR